MISEEVRQDGLRNGRSDLLRITFLLCSVLAGARSGLPQAATAYQLKSAFLFNFAKFVKWPAQTFLTSSDSFTLCVYGKSPVADVLEHGVAGKTIQSRSVTVKAVGSARDVKGCEVLYIGQEEVGDLNSVLPALQTAPVLTVGETANFTRAGGMIGFVVESDQLRFVINNAAAKKAGLKISSRLLSLAKAVKD